MSLLIRFAPPLFAAGVATIAMLAVPTLAAGATPKKGGSYEGTLYANSGLAVSKKIVIKVIATGTRARTTFWCGSQRPANWISFRDQEGRQLSPSQ